MDAVRTDAAALGPVAGAAASIAAAAVLPVTTAMLFYAAVGQGGFYRPQGSFFAAGMAALAFATIGRARGLVPLFAGIGALLFGPITSGLANGFGANTPQIVASLCVAAAVVPVARHLLGSGDRERFLAAIAWLGAGASIVGMLGVAFHAQPWAIRASGLWRAASTITYANAAGCLFVLTLGAAVALCAKRAASSDRLAAFLCLAGLAATLSRGAMVGCIVAVITLALLQGIEILRALGRPATGALIAFAGMLPSIAGTRPQPVPAVVAILAGAAVAVNAGRRLRLPRHAVAVALVVAVAGVFATLGGLGRVLERRALPASETRLRTWGNTLEVAMRRPVLGYGPGTFAIVEEDPRQGPVLTRYVHMEYLQAFVETGAIGVAGIAAALVVLGTWTWRARRRDDRSWALGAALCAAFAANSAFDFLWRFPLLVTLAFMWLTMAVTPPPDFKETA